MTDADLEQPKRGRGRPKGSRNRPKDGTAPVEPKVVAPKPNVADLDASGYGELHTAIADYASAVKDEQEGRKRSRAKLKVIRSRFCADGVEEARTAIRLSTEKGLARAVAQAERTKRVTSYWETLPIGAAPYLFNEMAKPTDPVDYTRMGREAFERGQNGECPDDIPAEHHADWETGWHNASTAAKHSAAA